MAQMSPGLQREVGFVYHEWHRSIWFLSSMSDGRLATQSFLAELALRLTAQVQGLVRDREAHRAEDGPLRRERA